MVEEDAAAEDLTDECRWSNQPFHRMHAALPEQDANRTARGIAPLLHGTRTQPPTIGPLMLVLTISLRHCGQLQPAAKTCQVSRGHVLGILVSSQHSLRFCLLSDSFPPL